ncbi:MAG: hypothetical protein NTX61_16900 [Bacteroidetes bacterium]|nr:hypothetical protein [Bacteroidota bacterium]
MQKQLATGLGGVIGSDYVQSRNQLYFVENNGKISVLDLIRKLDTIVFNGTATMPPDSSLDLINGSVAKGYLGDIRLDHNSTDGKLVMRPQGNCRLSLIGMVNFEGITQAELQNLSYSQDNLRCEGTNNQLTNGIVFGICNTYPAGGANFDYVKVQVITNVGGTIKVNWVTYRLKSALQVIGTGYNQPQDIKVTSGGRYAYVTENTGNFLRVDLLNANRSAAYLLASGLTRPRQIALDEVHGQAYVPEFTSPLTGNLWRIDLSSGNKIAVYTGLFGCKGLLISKDLRYAFVSESTVGENRVARIDLVLGKRDTLIKTLTAPFFMEWADDSESHIILAEGTPANRITIIDLTSIPIKSATLVPGVANGPSSFVLPISGKIIVCSDTEIDQYDLVSSAFSPTGPIFLGIGLIPFDHIINTGNDNTDGYADTTDNPGYLLQVKDAPFGGGLAIMINHNAALLLGASYYKVLVNQVTPSPTTPKEPLQSFSDYLWDAASYSFIPKTTSPDSGGFYPVRLPIELWYNPLLGYMLDTSILSNGLCVIDIKLYTAAKVEIPIIPPLPYLPNQHSRRVKIDNQWPVASIEKIFHDNKEVQVCELVNSGSDQFTFRITATDPQGHLLSWNLWAVWGDDKSVGIGGDDYSHHISVPSTRQWTGVISGDVPTPAWHAAVKDDKTSTRCAHTFFLGVWDRVINGYGYLHNQSYHKSITIWL